MAGRAKWKPWPYPVAAGSVTSVDAAALPGRDHLLLYDEVRRTSPCAARLHGAALLKRESLCCAPQEGQLNLQGVQQPLRVTRQYAFNCAKLPVEVFFIGGDLGSGGSSVAPGEIPSISCKCSCTPACLHIPFTRVGFYDRVCDRPVSRARIQSRWGRRHGISHRNIQPLMRRRLVSLPTNQSSSLSLTAPAEHRVKLTNCLGIQV